MSSSSDNPPASTAAFAIAAAILAGVSGFFLGQASNLGLLGPKTSDVQRDRRSRTSGIENVTSSGVSDLSEDQENDTDDEKELQDFGANNEECKLVLVVRIDLGMTKGKIAAQCSHATLACYKELSRISPSHPILKRWERYGQAKVALQVRSEDELEVLQAQAVSLGLCAQIIHDAGRTQIASESATVLGVGPGPKSVVDQVTGHLKLL